MTRDGDWPIGKEAMGRLLRNSGRAAGGCAGLVDWSVDGEEGAREGDVVG